MAPDEAVASREQGEMVRRALDRLAEPYRTVLVLRHYEGMKLHEIAELLVIPEGTVKSRMAEALTRMDRMLRPLLGGGERLRSDAGSETTNQMTL
jgi:RNA polymerase sigma-70 factor (ECF subfamily)